MAAPTPTLMFNQELSATADVTRFAMLNLCDSIGDYVPDAGARYIDVYCATSSLNNVFYSVDFWGAYGAPNDLTPADYAAIIASGENNLSDQPKSFAFDWNALSAPAKDDLLTLDSNVFNQSNGDTYSFVSTEDPSASVQPVKSLLCDISLMGTVWYNHPEAILNQDDFHNPSITIDSALTILETINVSGLKEYRDDVFVQAYDKYKYDVSYQKLALQDGDSFSVPVRLGVTQAVNYDLSGSPISGGHSNSMLTFVVGSNEYSVMSQETSSNSELYMLRFVAVGAGPEQSA